MGAGAAGAVPRAARPLPAHRRARPRQSRRARLALIDAARRLAEPDRMGRLFKALALCHPALPAPPGFDAHDRRYRRSPTAPARPRTASSPAEGGVSRRPLCQPQLQPLRPGPRARRCWRTAPAPPRALGADPARLVGLTQVHGADVVHVTEPWAAGGGPRADAMVTDRPGHRARHRHRRLRAGAARRPERPAWSARRMPAGAAPWPACWRRRSPRWLRLGADAARDRRRDRSLHRRRPPTRSAADLRDAVLARDPADARFFRRRRAGALAVRPARLLRRPARRGRRRPRSSVLEADTLADETVSSAIAAARSPAAGRSATRSRSSRCDAAIWHRAYHIAYHSLARAAVLLSLAACGDLPRPFQGNPGATAERLAQPPPAAARRAGAGRRAAARRRQRRLSPTPSPRPAGRRRCRPSPSARAYGRLAPRRHAPRPARATVVPHVHA